MTTGLLSDAEARDRALADALGLGAEGRAFPWQRSLLEKFYNGQLPAALDIPTGLGKTATMAIWLIARASGAPVPRRLVYIVDRRAVVDQATDVALGLRDWLDAHPELREALGLGSQSLPISTLRGQFTDNREWLEDPSRAAIIIGTVDMIGSRLLFEGYATSRKMRPYHAAMLAHDTLIALDEAHLVPPFQRLLETIAARPVALGAKTKEDAALLPGMHLLTLSATGRGASAHAHCLDDEDREEEVVKQRLNGEKRLRVRLLPADAALSTALAEEAWRLAEAGTRPRRILIFCNRRADAEATLAALSALAGPELAVELIVGGRRVFERSQAADRLHELGFLAGTATPRERPAFVIATSAGEVGIDLDADDVTCDLVAWERMVQRLGRVNRRGASEARVEVLIEPLSDKASDEAMAARRAQREAIAALRELGDGAHDASLASIIALKDSEEHRPLLERATTPAPLAPELTRPLLEAWAMTSLEAHPGRPEVAPWLRGWVDDEPQSRLVWRRILPAFAGKDPSSQPAIARLLEAAPPHTSELLETETLRAFDWLCKRVKARHKALAKLEDEEQAAAREQVALVILDRSGGFVSALRFSDLRARLEGAKGKKDAFARSLRDRTLVFAAELGGLERGLLDPRSDELPLTGDGEEWLSSGEDGPPALRFRVRQQVTEAAALSDPNWRERARIPQAWSGDGDVEAWIVVEQWRSSSETEDDRSASHPQRLEEHQDWAGRRARRLAEALGLPERAARMLEVAAQLHDEGKRAVRWQRAFHAPEDGPYAKTRGPVNPHLLDGYRHEFGSLPYAQSSEALASLPAEDQDLALHLIAAHHGFARPLLRADGCDDAPPSALEARAREVAERFFALQARWGPWGLAWWEMLLRAADQQASRENDARGRVTEEERS